MTHPRVLVVADDLQTRAQIRHYLQADFTVQEAESGRTCLQLLSRYAPALLLLDAMMPKMDGWEILRRVRSMTDLPVIVLKPRGRLPDWTMGLPLGADDYVQVPIDKSELIDRIQTALKRANPILAGRPIIVSGDLVIGVLERRAVWRGRTLSLSAKEFDLLALLAANDGRPLSREQILARLWGSHGPGEVRVVDEHVKGLRLALGDGAALITNVPGVGYQFTPPTPLPAASR